MIPQTVKNPEESAREPKPSRIKIVPGGVYGGDGAIFAAENPIFQSKNRFLTVSAPENPQDFSGNWRGAHEGRRLWRKQAVVSPISKGVLQAVRRSRTTSAN